MNGCEVALKRSLLLILLIALAAVISRAHAFEFLVFGDSQSSGDYALWRATVNNAYKANPDAAFMVNVGDLVDNGCSKSQWNAWFSAASDVLRHIPEMPVVGNHDSNCPDYWRGVFKVPQNGPEGLKGLVYSFDRGPAHFVVLDSQADLAKQAAWLDADLAKSHAVWKIVFFHRPPYEIKLLRSNKDVRRAFVPVLERHHVDIVFNGHDHGIARTWPVKDGKRVERPSQGTVYFIAGRSGSKVYRDLFKKKLFAFFYNPLRQPNYLVADVSESRLTVRTVKQDGTPIDTFSIDKNADTDSDASR